MVMNKQSGFTLVEIVLVMAIGSSLLVGVLAAQKGLRDRTQFDASVNLVSASIAAAQNEAQSGVNINAALRGTGQTKCPGGPNPTNTFPYRQYVYAGVEWNIKQGSPLITVKHYEALEGTATACVYSTTFQSIPGLSVDLPSVQGLRVLYIKTSNGGLKLCKLNGQVPDATQYFAGTACPVGSTLPATFRLRSTTGYTANVTVDESGLARRN